MSPVLPGAELMPHHTLKARPAPLCVVALRAGAVGPSLPASSPLAAAEPKGSLPEQEPGAPGTLQQQTPQVGAGAHGVAGCSAPELGPRHPPFPPGARCVV